ncbi:MAG: DUF423 domain-containing protein [Verrucomicrobiota bacterium]
MNQDHSSSPHLTRIAAVFGFVGVALGAFGAHALRATLLEHQTVDLWKTASSYHLIHAVLLVVISFLSPSRKTTFVLVALGIFLFSGSLYLMALYPLRWLGPITPLGGLLLLSGWLSLLRKPQTKSS